MNLGIGAVYATFKNTDFTQDDRGAPVSLCANETIGKIPESLIKEAIKCRPLLGKLFFIKNDLCTVMIHGIMEFEYNKLFEPQLNGSVVCSSGNKVVESTYRTNNLVISVTETSCIIIL